MYHSKSPTGLLHLHINPKQANIDYLAFLLGFAILQVHFFLSFMQKASRPFGAWISMVTAEFEEELERHKWDKFRVGEIRSPRD